MSPLACLRVLIAVTDHAAERFRQRVRGTLEPKAEVVSRVDGAYRAGRVSPGDRGRLLSATPSAPTSCTSASRTA